MCSRSGRSARLAKKARNRAPAMIIAQNVLLRKLRLRTAEHVESSDFDHYLNLFKEGLTEDQVRSGSFSSSQPHRPGMAPHWRKPPDVLRAGRIVGRHCFPHGTGKYPSIVCLQETKLIVISDFDMVQFIGPGFNYVFRPADGTVVVFSLLGALPLGSRPTRQCAHIPSRPSCSTTRVVRIGGLLRCMTLPLTQLSLTSSPSFMSLGWFALALGFYAATSI
jgi:hypothetical protein